MVVGLLMTNSYDITSQYLVWENEKEHRNVHWRHQGSGTKTRHLDHQCMKQGCQELNRDVQAYLWSTGQINRKFCRCRKQSRSLSEAQRLRISEINVLWKKITSDRGFKDSPYIRKCHNEELHNPYFSNVIKAIRWRKMQWTAHIACRLKIKNDIAKLQRQNLLLGYSRICEDNTKMAF